MRRHLAQLVLQLAFHGFNGAISVQLVQSLLHSSILFTRGVELRAVCGVRCFLLVVRRQLHHLQSMARPSLVRTVCAGEINVQIQVHTGKSKGRLVRWTRPLLLLVSFLVLTDCVGFVCGVHHWQRDWGVI